MGARVLWRDAQGREGSLDLSGAEAVIGRAIDCAIRTDDAMVSRHHARLIWDGGHYVLEDLGSANGIYFQERRVSRHALSHGDAVRCGSLWIRFLEPGGYATPRPEPPASYDSFSATDPRASRPPPPLTPEQATAPPVAGQRSGRTAYLPPDDAVGAPSAPRPGLAPGVRNPGVAAASPSPRLGTPPRGRAGDGSPARDAAQQAQQSPQVLARELMHMQRRVEQLKAELRVYRGGGDNARTYDELEDEIDNLTRERNELRRRVEELETILAEDGASAKVRRAGAIAQTAGEIVNGLNDVLSNLRINVMAAEGEFEQFSQALPRASFELIREALRSSAADMESARDILRELRKIAGVG